MSSSNATVHPPGELAGNPRRLSTEDMDGVNAGADTTISVLSKQQLTGTTSGNTISAGTLASGAVNFNANALNNFNGVGNFVINTGANNTIQGAISISIVTPPTP